jgi:hypothetical protein
LGCGKPNSILGVKTSNSGSAFFMKFPVKMSVCVNTIAKTKISEFLSGAHGGRGMKFERIYFVEILFAILFVICV